jgi:Raf kinase inhibitor-like YbhB/YbcL family protein
VPADLPRVDFFHWVLVDIPAEIEALAEAADSDGVTARGKKPGPTPHGLRGINNYTDWFSGDADMEGDYGGYDGPCPPWNDSIIHHYHFTVYALDLPSLGLEGRFGGPEALKAMEGHVLAQGKWIGTYTLNPALRAG